MTKIRLTIFLATVMGMFCAPIVHAQTTSAAPCVLGYTVGFFNGVWNTETGALDALQAVQNTTQLALGTSDGTYNHEDVGYTLFYNHTGSAVGSNGLQDIAEVFVQRANQLDSTGYFAQNGFYMFWEALENGPVFTNPIGAYNSAVYAMLQGYLNQAVVSATATISATFSSPPTTADYAAQNAQLDTLASAGRKFVLVAHSQGNLFVDQAYDHIQPVVGSTRVQVVHVAPASVTLRGGYLLSSHDAVINGLRLQGGSGTVQPNNITIPISTSDLSGHELVATYLDPTRSGLDSVKQLISTAFSALETSTCNAKITPGTSYPSPSQSITLAATVNPPPDDSALNVGYAWSISGNAGGVFSTGSGTATTVNTSTNTVNYIASPNSGSGQTDVITVKVLVAKTAGDYINVETIGTGTAVVNIQSAGLKNGNFTQGLTYWTSIPSGGTIVNTQMPNDFSTGASCGPLPEGTPFAQQNTYGTDISLEQTFIVPSSTLTSLSMLTWNNLDPVQEVISIIDSTGKETVLGSPVPPSMQMLSDPTNYYSVVCTGNAAATLNYSLSQFAGKTVTLRLRSYFIGGINGTFGNFANVTVK